MTGRWGDAYGINTYSYTQSMTAADCVRRLSARGVAAVELMLFPGHLWIDDPEAVLRDLRGALAAGGMTPVTLNGPNIDINIAAATAEMRAFSLQLNEAYLRLAGAIGISALILGPGKPNPLFPLPAADMEGHFHTALERLLPLARSEGVEIWVENMPFAFLPGADALMAALARFGDDGVGVCYDVANAHFIGEDPVAGLHRVRDRLRLVHLSDTNRRAYRHDPVGAGDVDFAAILAALRAAGLPRRPMLEIIAGDPDRDIGRSIDRLAALQG